MIAALAGARGDTRWCGVDACWCGLTLADARDRHSGVRRGHSLVRGRYLRVRGRHSLVRSRCSLVRGGRSLVRGSTTCWCGSRLVGARIDAHWCEVDACRCCRRGVVHCKTAPRDVRVRVAERNRGRCCGTAALPAAELGDADQGGFPERHIVLRCRAGARKLNSHRLEPGRRESAGSATAGRHGRDPQESRSAGPWGHRERSHTCSRDGGNLRRQVAPSREHLSMVPDSLPCPRQGIALSRQGLRGMFAPG